MEKDKRVKEILMVNLDKLHTTPLGAQRISNNLNIAEDSVVDYIKNMILKKRNCIYQKGKNIYCENNKITITINASNFNIITAKKVKPKYVWAWVKVD